jgi:ATP-dependent helicase YprA (DUF1998 family)
MSQNPAQRSKLPVVQLILEKAKDDYQLPDPYRWQILSWEHMYDERPRDVLVIAGPGSGKSLIFALLHLVKKDGVTLVVSPLVALSKDQVQLIPFACSR